MFHSGTQRKHWTFSLEEVSNQRQKAHDKYLRAVIGPSNPQSTFLNLKEEEELLSYYGNVMVELCGKFIPPAPASVYGTSLQYFKRFYMSTSVMDYHPRDVMYTCIFFATKVEEYNVSINQFMNQIAPNYKEIGEFIISTEMLMMQKLNFHLTVHNPYRPFEGFLMDIKVRVPEIKDPEKYRVSAEKFITRSLLTYAPLVYAPSIIALAAIKSVFGQYIEGYIIKTLGGVDNGGRLLSNVNSAIALVAAYQLPKKQTISDIENKLDNCRNHENNPRSEHYRETERRAKEKKEMEKLAQYELSKQKQSEIIEGFGVQSIE